VGFSFAGQGGKGRRIRGVQKREGVYAFIDGLKKKGAWGKDVHPRKDARKHQARKASFRSDANVRVCATENKTRNRGKQCLT